MKKTLTSFKVSGISTRTTNQQGKAAKDIPALWQEFMEGHISEMLPGKLDQDVYCVYTDYEGDHNLPYTVVIGHKVNPDETVPKGLNSVFVQKSNYVKKTAKGDLTKGAAVIDAWMEIWNSDIPRSYTSDFEVYGDKSMDPSNAEVDIFVAIE